MAPSATTTSKTSPEQVSRHQRTYKPPGGLCEPDPLDPDRVPCSNPVVLDDRQGISHFFGRNKRATSTIPTFCYPLQCRTHYQERKYRMKDMPGQEAAYQCDCISITLMRMSRLTWTDDMGLVWPRWCGFELQLCHAKEAGKESGNESEHGSPSIGKGKQKIEETTTATRKRKRRPVTSAPVPDWLVALCSSKHAEHDFAPVGERRGGRYTYDQLASIVRSMKSWCINNDARLPAVEALPVTPGLLAEAEANAAKNRIQPIQRLFNLAEKQIQDAKVRGKKSTKGLEEIEDERSAELNDAKESYRLALADLEGVKDTLPVRRKPKKRTTKAEDIKNEIESEAEAIDKPPAAVVKSNRGTDLEEAKGRLRRGRKARAVASDTDMEG
ncbi:uncharacterized protein HMPREF1541_03497 [Cyphellophora europaea CBS 101466]|uniref:Uncharacterized protein n=1 Tax=Cyphellophora europaea (strain CBS 101466) TaxID=1220924 RepID=W2RYI2_CYPE1|nr:uncharacterized protein HMPREF1541_03497 [Cyphellophora europaea CBS 101466]ETN41561.1 hypothetical protein HMPREF1541_03497 [Cyphellophora europaea CBS 101466]